MLNSYKADSLKAFGYSHSFLPMSYKMLEVCAYGVCVCVCVYVCVCVCVKWVKNHSIVLNGQQL